MNDLSTIQMALLFCGGFVIATWGGILLCRPYARRWIHSRRNANDMIGFALASYATLYGILLGLLAVEAYQDFSSVQDTISRKAVTLATLYQDLDSLPRPLRERLQAELRNYAGDTLEMHWNATSHPISVGASPRLRTILAQLLAFQPTTKGEELMQEMGVQRVNTLIEQRRTLLASAGGSIPEALWWVVGLGAALFMLLMCLFDMEPHAHFVLSGALAIFLGLGVYIIATLDNPFGRGVTVTFDPVKAIRDELMKPAADDGLPREK
ncbi:MAG: hypothetical protein ACR652_11545 [Methylocystis sp.]|uniref:bestrophin-like domain n=1 Tax=Methylocystis sp. TaxID=1911079 RepID=UPI003DA20543